MALPFSDALQTIGALPAGWTNAITAHPIAVASYGSGNAALGDGGGAECVAINSGETYNADQKAQVSLPLPARVQGPAVRLSGSNTTLAGNYAVYDGGGTVYFGDIVAGVFTDRTTRTVTITADQVLALEVASTTFKVKVQAVQQGADITNSAAATGKAGFFDYDNGAVQNFVGDNNGGGGAVALAGSLRAAVARLLGALVSTLPLRSTPRGTPSRLRGALATSQATAGVLRGTPARLSGLAATALALAGRVRGTSSRLTGSQSAPSSVALAGFVRSALQVLRGDPTLGIYSAEIMATPARLTGVAATILALQGGVRETPARLTGFATTTAPGTAVLSGSVRMTSLRGIGLTTTATAITGSVRATPARLRGVAATVVALSSIGRTTPQRLRGSAATAQALAGRTRAPWGRLKGDPERDATTGDGPFRYTITLRDLLPSTRYGITREDV